MPWQFSILWKSEQRACQYNTAYIDLRPFDKQLKGHQGSQTMGIHVKWKIFSGLLKQQNDVILELFDGGTSSWSPWVSESPQVYQQNFKVLFGKKVSDGVKPAWMLPKTVNDANCSSGVWWSYSCVVESYLLFLSVKVALEDGVILFFGFSNKFLVHLTIIFL